MKIAIRIATVDFMGYDDYGTYFGIEYRNADNELMRLWEVWDADGEIQGYVRAPTMKAARAKALAALA